MFTDRSEAGAALSERLRAYDEEFPVVLGLNRGGVAVATPISRALGAPMDVLITRPITFADEPAPLGAVSLGGGVSLDGARVRELGLDPPCLDGLIAAARRSLDAEDRALRADLPLPDLTGHAAILVADGLLGPHDMIAALRSLRARAPRWLVMALPACRDETYAALVKEADAVVALMAGEPRGAVYESTAATSDAEAGRLLGERRADAATLYHESQIDDV